MPTESDRVWRDYVRYTGDGEPNEPVGKPLPVGDPASAVHNPKKAEIRALMNEFEAPTMAANGVPAFETWAQASIVTIPVTAKYIIVNGRLYRRLTSGTGEFTTAGGINWAPVYVLSELNLPILIIATGQSNMLGGSGASTGERATINGNVYMWEQFPGAGQTTGWKAAGPASTDWPFMTTGNHLAYHFADMLQRETGRTVLVVHHSVGGTPIAEWMPSGGGVSGATGTMWSALNSIMTAIRTTAIPGRSDGATLASLGVTEADMLLWHQGEADADYKIATDTRAATQAQYLQRFRSIISAMRDPAGSSVSADPMLKKAAPVLVGELLIGGTSSGSPTDDRNIALRKLGAEEALVTCVPSAGLLSTDNLHFNGRDLVEFARRYFHALGNFPKQAGPMLSTSGSWSVLTQPGGVVTLTQTITLLAGVTTAYTFPVTFENANYPVSISHQQGGSSSSSADIHHSLLAVGGLSLRNSSASVNAIFRLTIGPWKTA